MPHKRAKRSIRTAETAKKGQNLPPKTVGSSSTSTYAYDDTPRLGARILNSHKVQEAFHASGRISSEDTGERRPKSKSTSASNSKLNKSSSDVTIASTSGGVVANTNTSGKGKGKASTAIPKIMANESLGDYNRRVEAFMRPVVSQAIKDAAGIKASQERAVREEKKARRLEAKEARLRKEGKLPPSGDGGSESGGEETVGKGAEFDGKSKKPIVTGAGGESENLSNKRAKHDSKAHHQPSAKPKEFAEIPAPRRLNDIVQAPPQLPHLRRSKTQTAEDSTKSAFRATGRNPLSIGQQRLMEVERERVVGLYREMKSKRAAERVEEERLSKMKSGGRGSAKTEKRKRDVE